MTDFKITEGLAYYIGERIATDKHKHHALEFIFSIDKPFNLFTDNYLFENIYSCAILPDTQHQFIGTDGNYMFLYLEPELVQSEEIISKLNLTKELVTTLQKLEVLPNSTDIFEYNFFNDVLRLNISSKKPYKKDERINRTIDYIKNNIQHDAISSDELASNVFLSTSRFAHLFKAEIGIPVRQYILWCRMQEALISIIKGFNFTEAAHYAGFSDSPHFNRTFKDMFGVIPSGVLKR